MGRNEPFGNRFVDRPCQLCQQAPQSVYHLVNDCRHISVVRLREALGSALP